MANSAYDNFIGSYKTIRKELKHFFLYGCYSRDDFTNMNKAYDGGKSIGGRKYDNERRRLLNAVGIEHFQENYIDRTKIVSFSFDMFEDTQNYLFNTYKMSTFSPNDIHYFYLILQSLMSSDQGLSKTQLEESLEKVLFGELDPSTLGNYLKKMTQYGYITRTKDRRSYNYQLLPDPFSSLSNDQLVALLKAISFYRNLSVVSVPGYSCYDVLKRYLCESRQCTIDTEPIPIIFKHHSFNRMIDDEITYKAINAILDGKDLSVTHTTGVNTNWTRVLTPLNVVTEYIYGRQYLYGYAFESQQVEILRIDRISDLKAIKRKEAIPEQTALSKPLMDAWTTALAQDRSETTEVVIDFLFDQLDSFDAFTLVQSLESEKKDGHLTIIHPRHYRLTLDVAVPGELKPWLRSYPCIVNVKESDKHTLCRDLKEEWKEALNNYDTV